MILNKSSARIKRLKAEGISKRKGLLDLIKSEEFTSEDLAEVSGLTKAQASSQVKKMVLWREVEPVSEFVKPRTYRKI